MQVYQFTFNNLQSLAKKDLRLDLTRWSRKDWTFCPSHPHFRFLVILKIMRHSSIKTQYLVGSILLFHKTRIMLHLQII